MSTFAWRDRPVSPGERAVLRREAYLTSRLHVAGLRGAAAGIIVGVISILAAQALSGVQLTTAWLPVISVAIAGGAAFAAAPLLAGFGKPREHLLDGDGIRIGGEPRIPWSRLRGYWTAVSPLGHDVLHLVTTAGGHRTVDLPPPPLVTH